jgi:hypothetical protein
MFSMSSSFTLQDVEPLVEWAMVFLGVAKVRVGPVDNTNCFLDSNVGSSCLELMLAYIDQKTEPNTI